MKKRAGKFQLLNKTQKSYILGKLTKNKNLRSKFYHPNPSKVKTEIVKNIEEFNENFKTFSEHLSLLRDFWKDEKTVDKMYGVLVDFFINRLMFDWKFVDTFHKKKDEVSEKLQQISREEIFKGYESTINRKRLKKLAEKLENFSNRIQEDLEWLLKPHNEEYLKIINKLIKEGFLTEWELVQEGRTSHKILRLMKSLEKRNIITNPSEKAWKYLTEKYFTPFISKRQFFQMSTPILKRNKVWIFTPYGSKFIIILQKYL